MSLTAYRYVRPEELGVGDRFVLTLSATCQVTSVDKTGVAANVDLTVEGQTFPTAFLLDDLRRMYPDGVRVIAADVESAIRGILYRLDALENPGGAK